MLTLDGEGVPTFDSGEESSYLGRGEMVPTLDRGRGYLSWTGGGVHTLNRGRGTYLGPGEEGTYLRWGRGYLPWTPPWPR